MSDDRSTLLRTVAEAVRNQPYDLSDVIPLLRGAADELDALRAEIELLRATPPSKREDLRCVISDLADECNVLRAEVERLRSACSRENDTISQVLGRALDYPRFADDQTNFPGATDANGVCIGDHVAASLADEAAYTIRALRAENAELASWQCIHRDGKTGLTHDECGNASCAKDRIIVEAKGELERLRAEVETLKAFERAACDLLPGAYYMDPPDGGDVSIIEQLRRMSEDAAKARAMQRLTDINQSLGLYDAAPQPPAKEGKT